MKKLRDRDLVGFKIWYGDGSIVKSTEQSWENSPQKNIQVIKLFYKSENGIETDLHFGQDYYLLDDLIEVPKSIKIGRAIDGEEFYKILSKANLDDEIVCEGNFIA